MKRSLVRAAFAVCLLGSVAALSAALPTAAYAAGPSVSAPVAKLLMPAQKLMTANDFAGAKVLILQAQALSGNTDFDNYEINNFLGNVSIKLNDHPTADAAFEAMADSPAMPDADKASTLRIATLLATEAKHFDKSVKYGLAFSALGGAPDELVLASIGQSYYYLNDFANAEIYGQKAVAAAPAGKSPNRAALEVVFGSQIKLKRQADAVRTLETILTNYDDADEWGQLIDIQLGAKGMKDIEALMIYRLRVAAKATAAADDYSVMAALALSIGYPGEAQAALEAGLASGKLSNSGKIAAQLSEARGRAAKDRASLPGFDAMATKAASGELDVKLAETYYGYGRYADAEKAARRGLGKGGAKMDANEANMVLGIALVMQGKNADALAAFNAVRGASPAMSNAQHIWSLFAGRKYAVAAPAQ